jgi:uncharacterized LabA/DUF88 family protein
MIRVGLYIDGFNLYFGLCDSNFRRYLWLNPELLGENLLRRGQQLDFVKYFSARIKQSATDPDKHKRQALFLRAVESLPKTTAYYGHYLEKQKQCRACGATWLHQEEKMTDVNISVYLLLDAFDNKYDTALLLSADSDLATPVEAVLNRFPGKRVIMVAPPGRKSFRLARAASANFTLGRTMLQNSQFSDPHILPDGTELHCPKEWL